MSKKDKVCCNLIMCDMYAYNPDICKTVKSEKTKKYFELQTIPTSTGIKEELVEVDYPITPEYVASFEQSANYKNDVNNAISNGTNRSNLGDVTAYQEVLAMDTQLISDLANRLNKANDIIAKSQHQAQQTAQKQTEKGDVNNA